MATTTTSSSSSSLLQPRYLANTSLALSTFLFAGNSYFLFNPRGNLEQLGYKPSTPSPVAEALMQMNAASRIALSVGSIAMWWYQDYRALGFATMATTVMGAVDGFVAEKLGGSKTVHWGSVPVGLLIGGGLLALVGV